LSEVGPSLLTKEIQMNVKGKIGVSLVMLALSGAAWAHGASEHKASVKKQPQVSEETAFGRAGDAKKASRTIEVGMDDTMHFSPGDITLKRGETVRFVVRNNGKIMHEMVIGTMKELKEHAALMKKFPNMEHDEPYMAHVFPGKKEDLVWQFTKPGEFYYACLIPGHLEAGMIAKISVK
jgi:uncharacterized cupredoxin-like copper-binding protein